MSYFIRLLFILVLFLSFNKGSTAQHDPNYARPASRVQWNEGKKDEVINAPVQSHTWITEETTGEQKTKKKNDQKIEGHKIKKVVKKTSSSTFNNFDELPRYERIKMRMLYELDCARKRLYNRFFNYSQYVLDMENGSCVPEFFDNTILSAIVSTTAFLIYASVHVFQVGFFRRS